MFETTEESKEEEPDLHHHEELGEYINRLRRRLHITITQVCADCHFSRRSYYYIIRGKDMKFNFYRRILYAFREYATEEELAELSAKITEI
jgi:predicted transcriptional regulator